MATSLAELLAAESPSIPPLELLKRLAITNAGLPSYGVPVGFPAPRYTTEQLNAGGYTLTDGPYKGQVVVANPQNLPRENVLGHESFHAQAMQSPLPVNPVYGAFGSDPRTQLDQNMGRIQPSGDVAGPYWGLRPNSSIEEQIANLRGYEASLPRGMPITGSPIADKLFAYPSDSIASLFGGQNQDLKDYYFTQSSIPHGGVWEGQAKGPDIMDAIKNNLRAFLVSRGINMVNR